MKIRFVKRTMALILSFLFSFGMLISLNSCGEKKIKWNVQGSYVWELTHESMNEVFIAEQLPDYSSFCRSAWADYCFVPSVPAKEERYDKEYFAENDLIVLKFNLPEMFFTVSVVDVLVSGDECTVVVLPIRSGEPVEMETTYGCFVETKMDVSAYKTIKLSVMDALNRNNIGFNYMTMDNRFYSFDDQPEPRLFLIDNQQGLDDFNQYDEIINKQTGICPIISQLMEKRMGDDQSLLLVRLPSSTYESVTVNYEDGKLSIDGVYSDHYLTEGFASHCLEVILIPKDAEITEITRTIYYEYEDDLPEKKVVTNYSLNGQNAVSEDCTEYIFAESKE